MRKVFLFCIVSFLFIGMLSAHAYIPDNITEYEIPVPEFASIQSDLVETESPEYYEADGDVVSELQVASIESEAKSVGMEPEIETTSVDSESVSSEIADEPAGAIDESAESTEALLETDETAFEPENAEENYSVSEDLAMENEAFALVQESEIEVEPVETEQEEADFEDTEVNVQFSEEVYEDVPTEGSSEADETESPVDGEQAEKELVNEEYETVDAEEMLPADEMLQIDDEVIMEKDKEVEEDTNAKADNGQKPAEGGKILLAVQIPQFTWNFSNRGNGNVIAMPCSAVSIEWSYNSRFVCGLTARASSDSDGTTMRTNMDILNSLGVLSPVKRFSDDTNIIFLEGNALFGVMLRESTGGIDTSPAIGLAGKVHVGQDSLTMTIGVEGTIAFPLTGADKTPVYSLRPSLAVTCIF